jgi:hypothetical protein
MTGPDLTWIRADSTSIRPGSPIRWPRPGSWTTRSGPARTFGRPRRIDLAAHHRAARICCGNRVASIERG